MPDAPCGTPLTTPTATSTGRTSRFLQALQSTWNLAWTSAKTFVTHALNCDDPVVDLDIVAFIFLFPLSCYWLQTRPKPDGNWVIAFGTIWAAVKLSNFRRGRGDQ